MRGLNTHLELQSGAHHRRQIHCLHQTNYWFPQKRHSRLPLVRPRFRKPRRHGLVVWRAEGRLWKNKQLMRWASNRGRRLLRTGLLFWVLRYCASGKYRFSIITFNRQPWSAVETAFVTCTIFAASRQKQDSFTRSCLSFLCQIVKPRARQWIQISDTRQTLLEKSALFQSLSKTNHLIWSA